MKLHLLAEAKFAKSEYAFHATKGDYLRSILKHGLIPNKSDGGYGSDETSLTGYQLTSLQGVYFTRIPRDVINIAKGLHQDSMSSPIVIVAKIQSRSAHLDEDRMISSVIDEKSFVKYVQQDFYNSDDHENYSEEEIRTIVDDHITDLMNAEFADKDERFKQYIRGPLADYFMEIGNYVLASESGDFGDESRIKELQEVLTRKLRSLLSKDTQTHHTFKVDDTIGFSGANRIVGILNLDGRVGWGDLGPLEPYATYGTVEHPSKLFGRAEAA